MAASMPRGDRVDYVVVERDGVDGGREVVGIEIGDSTPNRSRVRRTRARRQAPSPTPTDIESDDESDLEDLLDDIHSPTPTTRAFSIPSATSAALPESTDRSPTNKGPTETGLAVMLTPSETASSGDRQGGISQTTEHLLIAAGSIGATIVIVMLILAYYTMRKRGLTIKDVIRNGQDTLRNRGGPPPPPKYPMDRKQSFDSYMYAGNDMYKPRQAASIRSGSGSLNTKTTLQPLGRSDSFKQGPMDNSNSIRKSFILAQPPQGLSSHRRDLSATPSSPVLPIQDNMRRSASTRNTRSLRGDEEALDYSDPPRQMPDLPPPPTFRQFLNNRPSASQRPGLGGGMMSRFSWTNSNAPQTPHDPSRDTAMAPGAIGRDSYMTTRSSVPRFRTIDSWVNQQSTRVAEQSLKQQFRMTQSTTYDEDDTVPDMPPVPKQTNSAIAKEVKHSRHDTVDTAPIFKQHPGTEVRFSTRSTVPSEVLDMGRQNVAM